jgi:hypothetical protein
MKNRITLLLTVLVIISLTTSSSGQIKPNDQPPKPDTTKIETLIQKNVNEEEDLKKQLKDLKDAAKREELERQIALRLYKAHILNNLNKLKDQYIEGSNVLTTIIDNTNDLNTLVTYGNARSSFLELVNPLNYTDFQSSLTSIKTGLETSKQNAFWSSATDLLSNFQNFVANPSSIIPGIIGAAQKYGGKRETVEKAQYDLQKSISFISALYSNFEQLDRDDQDLNSILTGFSQRAVTYFPSYYTSFSENDITYANLGHPTTSQKDTKDAFKDRVTNHFNSLSEKTDKFVGGIESLKQQEQIIFSDSKIKFVRNANLALREYLTTFDENRQKVIDRIVIFRELTKSYSRAKGLNYSKDNTLQQTITVLNNFKDGGYQIQNSSRQTVLENIR